MFLAQYLFSMAALTLAAQPILAAPDDGSRELQAEPQAQTAPAQPAQRDAPPPYSVDRIKRLLAAKPEASDIEQRSTGVAPTGQRHGVDIAAVHAIPRVPATPIPWGAPTHAELMAMSIPRNWTGSSQIRTWGNFGAVMGVSLLNALASYASSRGGGGVHFEPIKAIKDHFRQAKISRIRREIREDLEAFERADGQPAQTAPADPAKKK